MLDHCITSGVDFITGLVAAGGVDLTLQGLLYNFGPAAVFLLLMLSGIGLPLGEDLVTIPAGALIAAGHLDPTATLLCAYFGVLLSDSLWFSICSRYGRPLLHKRWFKRLVHPRRLLQAKHQLDERGVWFIVMVRFIPSSRTAAITVAGMFDMKFWKFAAATAGCVLITVPMQLGLGYLIGRGIQTEDATQLIFRLLGLIMLISATLAIVSVWTRHRLSKTRTPRAKAKWLRKFRPRRRKKDGTKPGRTTGVTSS